MPTSHTVTSCHISFITVLIGHTVAHCYASHKQCTYKVADVRGVALHSVLTRPQSDCCCPRNVQRHCRLSDITRIVYFSISVQLQPISTSRVLSFSYCNALPQSVRRLSTNQCVGVTPGCATSSFKIHTSCPCGSLAAPNQPLQLLTSDHTHHRWLRIPIPQRYLMHNHSVMPVLKLTLLSHDALPTNA